MPACAGMTDNIYFFAVFIASGVYRIGEDHTHSRMVAAIPCTGTIPCLICRSYLADAGPHV